MKQYLINKDTEEKVEVKLSVIDGERTWVDVSGKTIICKLGEEPENVKVLHECSDERVELGEELKAYRSIKGMSLDSLAKVVGTTKLSIIHYERGSQSIGYDQLVRIGQVLGFHIALVPNE